MELELKLGADPEAFILGPDGVPVSAHGLLPGTKDDPFPVDKGAIQVDGMAAEFNIEPASTLEEWEDNITCVIQQLEAMLPEGHTLSFQPLANFSKEVWKNTPDEAKILGCDPDMNAYTGEKNEPPNPDVMFRTAAGHIHFGWCEGKQLDNIGHVNACRILAKELDYFLGAHSTLYDFSPDSFKRRELYGAAGAFRVKPYGMEYRVLSNAWLATPELRAWVYETCQSVFHRLLSGKYSHQPRDNCPEYIVRTPLSRAMYYTPYSIAEIRNTLSSLDFPMVPHIERYVDNMKQQYPDHYDEYEYSLALGEDVDEEEWDEEI